MLLEELIEWTWSLIFHLAVQGIPNAVSCGVSVTHDLNTNVIRERLFFQNREYSSEVHLKI